MLKQTIKKHLINCRGPRISDKLVVFESDDWGSIRIPSQEARQELLKEDLIKESDPFSKYDTLETAEDYYALYDVFCHYRDRDGNHPVLTANVIMNNPDFDRIAESKFDNYYNESFLQTYKREQTGGDAFSALQEGIKRGMIYPQFHGSEHLNVTRWMKFLQQDNERYHFAFKRRCFSIDEVSSENRRGNLMAAYDYDNDHELDYIKKSISSGLAQFEKVFGVKSGTTVAPCFVWDTQVEKVLKENQVMALQGSFVQNFPVPGQVFQTQRRYSGQLNSVGQRYFVRNGLFEPSISSNVDWVNKCMESIAIAFKWGKPAIIGTHRINFCSRLDEPQRNKNLKNIKELLKKMLERWPEIEFLDSASLSDRYYSKY